MNKKPVTLTATSNYKLKQETIKLLIEQSIKDWNTFSEINVLNRTVFYCGDVEDCSIERTIRYMEYLQLMDDKKDIDLYINSNGGDAIACLKYYDALRTRIKVKVNTFVEGISMSAATIMSIATTGKRYITKNSTIMLHQLNTGSYGKITDEKNRLKWSETLQDTFINIYSEHTNIKDKNRWETILAVDTFYNAELSLKNGFVDEII